MSFERKSVRENIFIKACFCWDSTLSLRELDQKLKFGVTIGYEDSDLDFYFRHFKVFRLHAILHDAGGAVRAHSGKGPGYCYMMSNFNQPNIERKIRLWTTKYESLPEMCIVQHVEMKSVFTFQPIKRLVSTTVKSAKPAATF